jgi:tetratricopeptide (TPR) repeat protein
MGFITRVFYNAALSAERMFTSSNERKRSFVYRQYPIYQRVIRLTGITVAVMTIFCTEAVAENAVNLLKLPQVKLETTTLKGDALAKVSALTDGKDETIADFGNISVQTIDLVYSFGGEIIAPEAVAIVLSNQNGSTSPVHIEVLASTVSPYSGFRSLRSDPVDASNHEQKFAFTPTGARWIMIRVTPPKTGGLLSLAEIQLLGHQGPPVTNYTFGETPARIIDILSSLETLGSVKLAVSEDEKLAFQKAKTGHLNATDFADTALLASGVLDPVKRKAYLNTIDALEAKAKVAVGQINDPTKRSEALLRWLHKEVLSKGYLEHQTNLSVLLDKHTFNCVSSAVIYNIIGQRLGLDVRAIEVPDHAFSIVYQGMDHMDVETTNSQGFNPSRDPQEVEKFEKLTGFRYIPESHRDQRREVNEAGLAAIIYYNRGVELGHAKRYQEALLAYFRAMSLDPEFASAAKNALATLANWGLVLAEEGKWQEAIDVATVGLTLAPKDALLINNRNAIWSKWAISLIDNGRPEDAIAVLKRAAAAVPDGGFEPMQAWVYIKPGEDLVKAHKWQETFSATEVGVTKLDPVPRKELEEWRGNLFLRWTNSEIEGGHFEEAVAVLMAGLKEKPNNEDLVATVGYLGQEWAKKVSVENFAKGKTVLLELEQKFPTVTGLREVKVSYVWRHINALVEENRSENALAIIQEADSFINNKEELQRLAVFVFDNSAKAKMKVGAWSEAAEIYSQALKQYPENSLIKNNVIYLAQEWQKAAYTKGGLSEVNAITAQLVTRFPDVAAIRESGSNQIQRTIREHVQAANFEKALEFLKTASTQLNADELRSMNELIYDNWAKHKIGAKDWIGAADVYAAGLSATVSSDHLHNNAVYLAQEWARAGFETGGIESVIQIARRVKTKFPNLPDISRGAAAIVSDAAKAKIDKADFAGAIAIADQAAEILPDDRKANILEFSYDHWAKSFMDKNQWDEAIKIYDKGLERLPESGLFKNNRDYCSDKLK